MISFNWFNFQGVAVCDKWCRWRRGCSRLRGTSLPSTDPSLGTRRSPSRRTGGQRRSPISARGSLSATGMFQVIRSASSKKHHKDRNVYFDMKSKSCNDSNFLGMCWLRRAAWRTTLSRAIASSSARTSSANPTSSSRTRAPSRRSR